jgi:hypothetical protein
MPICVDWSRQYPLEGLLRYPIVSSMSCAWFASLHADLAAVAADAARRSAHFHFAHYETVRAVASAPAVTVAAIAVASCGAACCFALLAVASCGAACCFALLAVASCGAACCFALLAVASCARLVVLRLLRQTETPQTTPVLSLLGLLREDPYAFVGADVEQREFNGCGLRSGSP